MVRIALEVGGPRPAPLCQAPAEDVHFFPSHSLKTYKTEAKVYVEGVFVGKKCTLKTLQSETRDNMHQSDGSELACSSIRNTSKSGLARMLFVISGRMAGGVSRHATMSRHACDIMSRWRPARLRGLHVLKRLLSVPITRPNMLDV